MKKVNLDIKNLERIRQLEEENLLLKRQMMDIMRNSNIAVLREKARYDILTKEFSKIKCKLAYLELLAR